jgi:hypothetical protein
MAGEGLSEAGQRLGLCRIGRRVEEAAERRCDRVEQEGLALASSPADDSQSNVRIGARAYHEQVPERVLATLAAGLQQLAERGLLRLDDPLLAANHLGWLILGMPLDRAMFRGTDEGFTAAELERLADAGVAAFLAAYGGPVSVIDSQR